MGIHGLAKLIADHAPSAIKDNAIKSYFGMSSNESVVHHVTKPFRSAGRKVAIDASMCLYQFLIAVRQEGHVLTSDTGEDTRYCHDNTCMHLCVITILFCCSHLIGFFYRTIRILENGIKPV